MFPTRISLVTYNLWNTKRWPLRAPALGQFVQLFHPDVLCLQELRAETQAFLDEALPGHSRVHDDFVGWTCEGNVYWNAELFQELEHGAEDVGMVEEQRRLFWARLELKGQGRAILVGTAHFTYQGHRREVETGRSPRIEQARRTVAALQRLARADEPVFFMGDLNDPVHPKLILEEAGLVSCFARLGMLCPPTFPCHPTANIPPGDTRASQTIDWLMSNQHARPIACHVPHCYHGDIAPSDHWPVLAVYEI
jgi:endonuclease/exonuclease/phosphatase family metal-dependent hydrolase